MWVSVTISLFNPRLHVPKSSSSQKGSDLHGSTDVQSGVCVGDVLVPCVESVLACSALLVFHCSCLSVLHLFIKLASKWLKARLGFIKQQIPFICISPPVIRSPCRSWYFSLHLFCMVVVLALPVKSRRQKAKDQQDRLQKDGQTAHSSTDNNCNQKEKAS